LFAANAELKSEDGNVKSSATYLWKYELLSVCHLHFFDISPIHAAIKE